MPRPGCPTPPYPAQLPSQGWRNDVSPADSMAAHSSAQARQHAHAVSFNQFCGLAGPDSSAHPQNEDGCSSCGHHRFAAADVDSGRPDSSLLEDVQETSGKGNFTETADEAAVSHGHAQQAVKPCERLAEAVRKEYPVSDDDCSSSDTEAAGSQLSPSETGRNGQASITVRGIEDLDSLSGDESPGDEGTGASFACCCIIVDRNVAAWNHE